jgi:hypothetical protein
MGGVLTLRVTVTVTIAGAEPVAITVDVPDTGNGLLNVTIPFPDPIGNVVLVGIPRQTLAPITFTLGGTSVTFRVVAA